MQSETTLRTAEFTKKLDQYHVAASSLGIALTCFGIILLPIWIPIAFLIADMQRKAMAAVLTDRSLKVKRGIFVKIDKTIPLDKVTDLGMTQGPLMRLIGIHGLSVETAGMSTGPGALVTLLGVKDAEAFRDAVLQQRDRVIYEKQPATAAAAPASSTPAESHVISSESTALLQDIRDSLRRIEQRLDQPSPPQTSA